MRVLHLLEPDAGEEAIMACRAAIGIPGVRHDVWLVGGTDAERRAAASGVLTFDRVTAPMRVTEAAWRGTARLWRDRFAVHNAGPDVVQCWSLRAAGLVRLACGATPPRVVAVCGAPAGRTGVRWALGQGAASATLVSVGEDRREAWAAAGAPDVRFAPAPRHAEARAGRWADDGARVRSEILERVGLGGAAGGSWSVVALLTGAPGAADARRLAFILGLLYTAGRSVVGIVPEGAGQMRRAARFLRAHDRRWALLEWHGPMEQVCAACDAAVWDPAPGGAVLASSFADASVPVITGPREGAERILGSAASACVAGTHDLAGVAARLLPMLEDADLRRRTAATLRNRANAAPAGAFESVLAGVWRESVGAAPAPVIAPSDNGPPLLASDRPLAGVGR